MTLMDADVDAIKDGRCKLQAITDLRDAIEADNAQERVYDYILIDCPPAFSAASTAALMAADEVIIPIRLDAFSTEGMPGLRKKEIDPDHSHNPSEKSPDPLQTVWMGRPFEYC